MFILKLQFIILLTYFNRKDGTLFAFEKPGIELQAIWFVWIKNIYDLF